MSQTKLPNTKVAVFFTETLLGLVNLAILDKFYVRQFMGNVRSRLSKFETVFVSGGTDCKLYRKYLSSETLSDGNGSSLY